MAEYTNVTNMVDVPKNTGLSGFLEAIRGILRRPRILSINIDSRGKITYVRSVKDGEDVLPLDIDFDTLTPSAVIRSCPEIEEIEVYEMPAGTAIAKMFNSVAIDQMVPVAFCTNSATHLWSWFQARGQFSFIRKDEFFGLPLAYDDQLPDTALFLCASYERQSALVDTRKVYKITLM